MKYIPIPVHLLQVGSTLPVDVWTPDGTLLLRKGQPIVSVQHRDKLRAHQAVTAIEDALAWQRSYERKVHAMLREGASLQELSQATMPSEIRPMDYAAAQPIDGGWLDLQEVLRGILYQGGLAINPLPRLRGIEEKIVALLKADADDSLFCLLQALADESLGYCATHALLCAVLCQLTAEKMGLGPAPTAMVLRAALTMNIGMARAQDAMARQNEQLEDWQRALIRSHPEKSAEILRSFGVADEEHLDLVLFHHDAAGVAGSPHLDTLRNLLAMADAFVARLAARKTRAPIPAVKAVRTMVLGASGDAVGMGSAMAQAVGFYPPGSYVMLVHGELAVCVQRGQRAHAPWVVPIADKDGIPVAHYHCRDTTDPHYAIAGPVDFRTVRIAVAVDKVRKARGKIAV